MADGGASPGGEGEASALLPRTAPFSGRIFPVVLAGLFSARTTGQRELERGSGAASVSF